MHHDNPSDSGHNPNVVQRVREAMKDIGEPLGETGKFPVRLAVTHDKESGKVIIDFGKAVAWIGLDPQQARQLAESLRQHSYKAQGK